MFRGSLCYSLFIAHYLAETTRWFRSSSRDVRAVSLYRPKIRSPARYRDSILSPRAFSLWSHPEAFCIPTETKKKTKRLIIMCTQLLLLCWSTRKISRKIPFTISMNDGWQFFFITFVFRFVAFVGSGLRYTFTYVLGSWALATLGSARAWQTMTDRVPRV